MAIVPLRYIEYGVYGDLIIRYPKPYSIYLRGTMRSSGTIRGLPRAMTKSAAGNKISPASC